MSGSEMAEILETRKSIWNSIRRWRMLSILSSNDFQMLCRQVGDEAYSFETTLEKTPGTFGFLLKPAAIVPRT